MKHDAPWLTVVGNCQAESLRLQMESTGQTASRRIPPVHELASDDLPALRELLARTDILAIQPIRDDYRGLPLGTSQLIALLPPSATVVLFPVLRYDGLMPYQAIIRDPDEPSLNPPVVPYHDLRILAAAARGLDSPAPGTTDLDVLRRAAALSVGQMRAREEHHGTVPMADYLDTAPQWHTVNHPNNATLATLAQRVADIVVPGATVTPPADREMLGETDAPIDAHAARALGVHATARHSWTFRGREIPDAEIERAHFELYRSRPRLVQAGLERHAERLDLLGLMR